MNNSFPTRLLVCLSALFFATGLHAQTEATGMEYDFRTRTSASVDWKICSGLHLDGGYELRTAGNLSRIERHQVGLGIDWAPIKYFGIGAGYYFIGHYDSSKNFEPKHRVYLDLTGSYKAGNWKFSLRERLQLTHNAYDFNAYQDTPNLLELKSRFKVSYKGFVHLSPYAFFELKNCFNGPSFTYEYNEKKGKYSNYQFLGYSDAYINRLRGAIGLVWNIDRYNGLDFKFMTDWCHDKDIDTNAEGTKLKSYQWKEALNFSLCVAYVFSF